MKKLLFIVMLMVAGVAQLKANDTIVDATQFFNGQYIDICLNRYERMIITVPNGCTNYYFTVQYETYNDYPVILDGNQEEYYIVQFVGCGTTSWATVNIHFIQPNVPTETTTTLWKHQNEAVTLEAVGADSLGMYSYLWNTGATTSMIDVTESGVYMCEISDMCATATRTFIVKDNVEVYRATVDLETNLNKTTWQVTEAQAEYISEVKVYRDGLLVGTAPYQDGYFLDAIGSDNAARNYHLVAVTTEGEDCPLASYKKGTIHTTYYQDVNGNLNMTWNIPYVEEGAQGTPTYFQICKYDPNTEELTVVDQVNSGITDYTCDVNQFDGGQAVIAAVFSFGKGMEELSFSNLSEDILGVGENNGNAFRIYPNPAKDCVTVEGTGILTVTNALGQTFLTKDIDGKITMDLAQGLYFVQLNGVVRKIVVE